MGASSFKDISIQMALDVAAKASIIHQVICVITKMVLVVRDDPKSGRDVISLFMDFANKLQSVKNLELPLLMIFINRLMLER